MRAPVIGGMFGLADPIDDDATPLPVAGRANTRGLANARSAIRLFVSEEEPPTVWLPSYLCPAVCEAVEGLATDVRFYPITADLDIEPGPWLDGVATGDVVCVIDFFGVPTDRTWLAEIKQRGALVLEDASQALLSDGVGEGADATVFSPRKWVGVADGGILVRATPPTRKIAIEHPPLRWRSLQVGAALARRLFDDRGADDSDRSWYSMFRESEAAPRGIFAMSSLTESMLATAFDWNRVAQRRIENWRTLHAALGDVSLWETIPEAVVPLGFVARFDHQGTRDRVRQALIDHQVYPPIHWPFDGRVPQSFAASHGLSGRVLTLPCDQRYDRTDMQRIIDCVTNALPAASRDRIA